MAKRKKTVKKMTQAEKISKIPIEEVAGMKGEEIEKLRNYVSTLMSGYKRRVASFRRNDLVSFAQISFENSISNPNRKIKDMNRNQLLMEFARYSKFFNDLTSTSEGIRQVNREQDARIFGVDKKGRPIKTMSTSERTRFWTLYDEFLNQNPNADSRYGSDSVQQTIAEMMIDGEADSQNISSLLDRVSENLELKQREANVNRLPNVYSGRGPTIQ